MLSDFRSDDEPEAPRRVATSPVKPKQPGAPYEHCDSADFGVLRRIEEAYRRGFRDGFEQGTRSAPVQPPARPPVYPGDPLWYSGPRYSGGPSRDDIS